MKAIIEKISAITLKVAHMDASVRFYRDVLGMELLYGGPNAGFSSLRVPGSESPIINLQQDRTAVHWGRMIFHVADVDAFWAHLKEKGFEPEDPQDASWGERYFHLSTCMIRMVTSSHLRDRCDVCTGGLSCLN